MFTLDCHPALLEEGKAKAREVEAQWKARAERRHEVLVLLPQLRNVLAHQRLKRAIVQGGQLCIAPVAARRGLGKRVEVGSPERLGVEHVMHEIHAQDVVIPPVVLRPEHCWARRVDVAELRGRLRERRRDHELLRHENHLLARRNVIQRHNAAHAAHRRKRGPLQLWKDCAVLDEPLQQSAVYSGSILEMIRRSHLFNLN